MTTKHTSRNWAAALLAAVAMTVANHAGAQNLPAPVSGLEVLDLAGQPITTDTNAYSANFEATTAFSTVTFVFRHDPGYFELSNVSVVDDTTSSGNLLLNGDFSVGSPTVAGAGVPDWTYFIQAGNLFPEYLGYENGSGFFDGSTQAYDGIDQGFASNPTDVYTVSFDLSSNTSGGVYQQQSTNGNTTGIGGNGIDAVVYAGNGIPPTTVPDACSTVLMALGGLGVLALIAKSKQLRAAL
jgi:hypothetical protein